MSAADRMRRLRQRQRDGVMIARTEYPPAVIEMLIDLTWLREVDSEDPQCVACAVTTGLSEVAEHRRRKLDAKTVTPSPKSAPDRATVVWDNVFRKNRP